MDSDELEERSSRWIRVSIGLIRFEPNMMHLLQGLGRIDVQLCAKDAELIKLRRDTGTPLEDPDLLWDHVTNSYLWVLGSYELVRTLTQYMREGRDSVPSSVHDRMKETRAFFARLRVPLAKLEPASVHANTDGHIAYPGFHTTQGIAWRLNEELVVSRRELSDHLLAALEFTRGVKLKEQAEKGAL